MLDLITTEIGLAAYFARLDGLFGDETFKATAAGGKLVRPGRSAQPAVPSPNDDGTGCTVIDEIGVLAPSVEGAMIGRRASGVLLQALEVTSQSLNLQEISGYDQKVLRVNLRSTALLIELS